MQSVSPRMKAEICSRKIMVLIDSGSEITCISKEFYTEIQRENQIQVLPVSNLTVYVAVGKKNVRVTEKVYLTMLIWKLEISHSFIVVPGLSTEVIVGADWLKKHGGIINFKDEVLELQGQCIPRQLLVYRSETENKDYASCQSLRIVRECEDISKMGGALETRVDMRHISTENEADDEPLEIQIEHYVREFNHLSQYEKNMAMNLLIKYKDVFSNKPRCTHLYEHRIHPIVDKPIVKRSYPVPLHQKAAVSREIDRMLELGIIERSFSDCCNHIRIVEKKNGDVRICLDARFLNKIIQSDNEVPPHIEELMQKYEGSRFFSSTDLVQGYWQVPLARESRKYTAFHFNNTATQKKKNVKTHGPDHIYLMFLRSLIPNPWPI